MGLYLFSRHVDDQAPVTPSPYWYDILRSETCGDFVVMEIRYRQATNFEGRKILVFHGVSENKLKDAKVIDPHFSEHGGLVARFRPDKAGWAAALWFCGGCEHFLHDQQPEPCKVSDQ